MEGDLKEVRYDLYCHRCQYETYKEGDDPCDECLATPMNKNSHRPVNWKERKEKHANNTTPIMKGV